jgi:hypothetical protein
MPRDQDGAQLGRLWRARFANGRVTGEPCTKKRVYHSEIFGKDFGLRGGCMVWKKHRIEMASNPSPERYHWPAVLKLSNTGRPLVEV